ncbi:MAG: polysaccharide deacetylase family protein [Candidatus Methylacidiphilales bacterium]|nr:polysaccharide deacetylase family protein [Candidatus Methylacidiphilales bacterium]
MRLVQCWDDGVLDDIRVIEILRKHGAKASFNLNYGLHENERVGKWKFKETKMVYKLAKGELKDVYEGFLVANHTTTHPHLSRIPLEDAVKNIIEGRDQLEQVFGYAIKGFAYPFGDYNDAVENAIRQAGHVYARTTKNVEKVFPCENPMAFHANTHFLAADFWDKFQRVKDMDKDGDEVFYFWGHSYELITEEQWQTFDRQIERLSADPQTRWADLPDLFV